MSTYGPRRCCAPGLRGCDRGAAACWQASPRPHSTEHGGSIRADRPISTTATTTQSGGSSRGATPSIPAIDALARATRLTREGLTAALPRYGGRKGIVRAREALALVDPGAESPKETWLRLLFLTAGYPWPEAQCPIHNEFGMLIGHADGGWRDKKIAYEYEGLHHTDIERLRHDIWRIDAMREMGWIVIRVTRHDGEAAILGRLAKAWASRASVGEPCRPGPWPAPEFRRR
ncbi:hypothetical protein MINS_22910 [Mycolicibacterium insubricum]|nr:hypothetical protein MINS_22910 [Mycolicibacterium insubricum]